MVTNHHRAALLLQMIAEAMRNDILNPETITHALDKELSIQQLLYTRMATDLIGASYDKLMRENGNHRGTGSGSTGLLRQDASAS